MNFSVLTAHRAAFVNHLVGGTVWGIFSFVVLLLLTHNIKGLFTWSREEMLLLGSILAIILGIFNMFFQGNFDAFPLLVNKGKLDQYLLKPVDSQFFLSVWHIKMMSITRALIGIIFLVYVTIQYDMTLSLVGVLGVIPLMIVSMGIYYAIWSVVTTLTIWFDRATNIVELLHSLQGMMRIPPVAFQELNTILFLLVFPLTIVAATPVGVILGKSDFISILVLFITSVTFLFIARKFWFYALRFYTSASS